VSLQQGKSIPSHCVFCAVVAKKDEAFGQGSGELLGVMKALHKREKYDLTSFIGYYFIKILMFFTCDLGNLLTVCLRMG
jgi:hypothetical protein